MTPAEQAAAHDANFIAGISLLAEAIPGGSVRRYGGLTVAVTGVHAAFFNATWVTEPPDRRELDAAVTLLRSTGLPFVVHVAREPPDQARRRRDR